MLLNYVQGQRDRNMETSSYQVKQGGSGREKRVKVHREGRHKERESVQWEVQEEALCTRRNRMEEGSGRLDAREDRGDVR